MKRLNILLVIVLFIGMPVTLLAQGKNDIYLWWDFNDSKEIMDPADEDPWQEVPKPSTWEHVRGDAYEIQGLGKYVPGVKGSAFKFDGFSSYIEGIPDFEIKDEEIVFPDEITVESWVALGAYPWNWAPILTIGKYMVTGFYFGVDSRGRLGFHLSDATSVWHECNSKINTETGLGMDLRRWYHVVATYGPEEGIKIYLNGKLENSYTDFTFDYGIAYSGLEKGFRLGMNRDLLPPTDPIRDWATYPSRYTLDGIIDETKIYSRVLSAGVIEQMYLSTIPENEPEFAPRKFPSIERQGRFTANYTRLDYYPEWDALWPAGPYMDVVVQFEQLPVKLMFWRGTRYSPCWVTENGKWMADQSRETGNNWFLSQGPRDAMPTGCIEHMSDVQTRSSRVSIIENNPARITVNWRYLQMDVKFRQMDLPNNTGFGEWGNELYHIYPDGIAVRKVLPGRGGWQETIFLNEPGTRPEDNIELEAVTLMNLKGDSKTYTWKHGYPEFDLPNANIQIINLKAEYKPFIILADGGGFDVFNLEVRPEYSHFPWWNHWPVAQIISDGRSASAPDRASHSSLSWGDPGKDYALYGMTNDHNAVLKLARAWNRPPTLEVNRGFTSRGYDPSQRAYLIEVSEPSDLTLALNGSGERPVYNPVFVISGWGPDEISCILNGISLDQRSYKYGVEYDVNGIPTAIIWLKYESDEKTGIRFSVIRSD
ncbi:MAG: hypothetical protein AMS26_21195 [Bacteroides sp. SM23_62]|nr:MAG: hypothetical protein AMS26_21195 [Bacteroides sp. SM23_62]